jgi:PhoH-like ATPase
MDRLRAVLPDLAKKDPQFASKKVAKKRSRSAGGSAGTASSGFGSTAIKPHERLLRSGLVEIEALAFIRGRSIARRFFILDEAQQLTPHEVRTVITRISEGSKIVLIGDPTQIDNPYVDARSNGLVYCHNRMKGQPIAAHVKLIKGERSKLAELAANLL